MPESETAKAVQTMKDNGCGCIKYEGFTAGSMPEPHKVWERVFSIGTPYNWMFTQSLTRTQHGALDPNMMFSQIKLKYGITRIMDFGMDTLYVMDRGSEALVIDTAMGGSGKADLYAYIRNNVLTNPDAALDILLTHNHGDHILGIPSLVASGKVRRTYIHPDDKAGLLSTMEKFGGLTAETMHLQNVNAGDVVRIGQDELEVVHVTGHTPGSVVFFYKDYIFTGDAIGSGDLFLFKMTFDEFYPTIEHFMAEILLRNKDVEYEFLTGHLENLEPFSVDYLRHMMILVRDVIRGDIQPGIYTRKPGRMATYLDANIYYTGKTLSTDSGIIFNALPLLLLSFYPAPAPGLFAGGRGVFQYKRTQALRPGPFVLKKRQPVSAATSKGLLLHGSHYPANCTSRSPALYPEGGSVPDRTDPNGAVLCALLHHDILCSAAHPTADYGC